MFLLIKLIIIFYFKNNSGTCWMKKGSVQKSNAVVLNGQGAVCGIVSGSNPNPNPNPNPGPTQTGIFSVFFLLRFRAQLVKNI